MTWNKAYQLNHTCAMALVYSPAGEYDTYQTGVENAHIEATLAAAKRVMINGIAGWAERRDEKPMGLLHRNL